MKIILFSVLLTLFLVWLFGVLGIMLGEILFGYHDAESIIDAWIMALLWPLELFKKKDRNE